MNSIKPDQWLKWLTNVLVIQNGKVHAKASIESEGQQQLLPTQNLELVDDFDLVIEGPCSSSERFGMYDISKFPMGMYTTEGKDVSWLHEVIARNQPKKVLVYAECCSYYSQSFQELIQRLFPDIQWIFAAVPDLCESSYDWRDRLAERLLERGVLKVVDAPATTSTTPSTFDELQKKLDRSWEPADSN